MSGLEDLYREIILDHYRKPRNRGELSVPPAVSAKGFNPLCGDEIIVYISIDDNDRITEITTTGQGCSISQSSASMMSIAVKDSKIAEVRSLTRAFKSMLSIDDSVPDGTGSSAYNKARKPGVGESAADESAAAGNRSYEPVKLGDLEALQGVLKFPIRIKCATLCWNTLLQALEEAAQPGQQR